VAVQLEAARNEAAHANSHLELALSRSALLERAWVADHATALAVGQVRFHCRRRCCCRRQACCSCHIKRLSPTSLLSRERRHCLPC
jgi:hypothetical protein